MKKKIIRWVGSLLAATGFVVGFVMLSYAWVGSSFTTQLTSPTNLSTCKLYITCQGIAYDTLNTITHIYCQFYDDVDKDGVIDTGESSWTSFSDVTDFATTVNSNITKNYAGTPDVFPADSKGWIRMFAHNSAGELSADPDVEDILNDTVGNWNNETDCYVYITIPAGGLKPAARPRW